MRLPLQSTPFNSWFIDPLQRQARAYEIPCHSFYKALKGPFYEATSHTTSLIRGVIDSYYLSFYIFSCAILPSPKSNLNRPKAEQHRGIIKFSNTRTVLYTTRFAPTEAPWITTFDKVRLITRHHTSYTKSFKWAFCDDAASRNLLHGWGKSLCLTC